MNEELKEVLVVRCKVAGWGKDEFNGNYQNIIKEVEVPVLSGADCQTKLRNTRLGSSFTLDTNSFICAGGEAGKDACTVRIVSKDEVNCNCMESFFFFFLINSKNLSLSGRWWQRFSLHERWQVLCGWTDGWGHRMRKTKRPRSVRKSCQLHTLDKCCPQR